MGNLPATDQFKTLNNMGYMFSRSNPALNAFLKHAERTQGTFADIGCAYGDASLEALKRGAQVRAIDLDMRHLEVLIDKCPPADKARLDTECGHFPNTIDLSPNTYDGIFLSRLLIFLTHSEISLALSKVYEALKEGGLVYIISPSHLRSKWNALKPIFEQQKSENSPWPGKIDHLWDLIPETKETLPNKIQLIDSPSLQQGLIQAGFKVDVCEYFPSTATDTDEALALTYAIASKPH